MKLITTILSILIAFAVQGQSYTVTADTNTCRITFADGSSNTLHQFVIEETRYMERYWNLLVFDKATFLVVDSVMLANYPTIDSLKNDMNRWFRACNAGATPTPPTPPGPTDLFANARSVDLDGTNEYVFVTDADGLSFTSNRMALSAWVRPDDATSFPIIRKANEYFVELNATDQVEVQFIDASTGGAIRAVSAPVTTRENTWFHVMAFLDGDSAEIYISGTRSDTLQQTAGTFVAMENTGSDVYIGYDFNVNYADGYVDQVAIYDTFFNPLQVREITAMRDLTAFSQYDNVVSWWEFDSDTLGTGGITDRTGSNDGTLQSGEYADINPYVTWPRPLQLDTTYNITPMQDSLGNVWGGYSYYLNATDEYFYADDNDLLSFGNAVTDQPFSICAWSNANDNELAPFVYKEDEYYFAQDLESGHPTTMFLLFDGNFSDFIKIKWDQTTNLADVDTKHDLWCATYDGSGLNTGMEIYWDGKLITNPVRSSLGTYVAMHNTGNNVLFGIDDGKTRFFDGHYNEVLIFDVELTAAQVDSIYNSHAPLDETTTARADELVLYYRAYDDCWTCDSIYDQSGNNLNGLKVNMDITNLRYDWPRSSLVTSSTTFNGTNEYITFSDSDSLSFSNAAGTGDTSFTISFWAKQVPGAEGAISKPDEYEIFGFTSNDFRVRLGTAANHIGKQANNLWTAPQNFDHWVVTYDGSATVAGIKIYKNGVRVDNVNVSAGSYTAMGNTANPLRFGWAETINYYYGGQLSNITIMKGIELSLAQVEELYNQGAPDDPRKWTFYQPSFKHWLLNIDDDLTVAGGVKPYLGGFTGTATNMDATNHTQNRYPKN